MSFFTTYQNENPDFGADTFKCASDTVTKLLDTTTTSDRPGMLLGKVQSGKTRTFISILADGFDRGFDIAIVLSKNSTALIEQTVKRLQSEFKTFTADGMCEIYDIMTAPEKYTRFELQAKHIFIGKKQTHNLKRLIELFSEKCPKMADMRVLIIDDEADNASIGYAKRDGNIEATTIASQISELRKSIKNCSFLQVTATPYSLYLQPEDINVANQTSFKPTRPAFTSLVPVPDAYVGGDTYFGELAQSEDDTVESLIHHVVDHKEFDILKKFDGRKFKLEDALTSPVIQSFRHALVTFIVGGGIQLLNASSKNENTRNLRYSFLVHSDATKGSHSTQEQITEEIFEQLKEHSLSNSQCFIDLVTNAYDDLVKSLTLAGLRIPSLDEVVEITKEALNEEFITIIKVNSDEQVATMLDSTGQLKLRSPFNIFIGGQVLDRGVTLANLTGFYYGRRPQKSQQDTVLQHSRMYGYRRKDLAVTRFYTSNIIRQRMFEMEEFDGSLRSAIESAHLNGGDDSVQFIRRSATGGVVPCSPNKILLTTTKTLKPFKRLLPVGFQSDVKTRISKVIEEIDQQVSSRINYSADSPVEIPLSDALELLKKIEPTLTWNEKKEDVISFDWEAASSALSHLASQNPDPSKHGTVLLWTAERRNIGRLSKETSHSLYADSPDSTKTEGKITREHAIDMPILFLLRQDGKAENGWKDTPFYWPVIQAQKNATTAIYAESRD